MNSLVGSICWTADLSGCNSSRTSQGGGSVYPATNINTVGTNSKRTTQIKPGICKAVHLQVLKALLNDTLLWEILVESRCHMVDYTFLLYRCCKMSFSCRSDT